MLGPTYERLGYKRMILDLHYGTYRPDALVDIDADEIAEKMAGAGINSLLHFTRDHWGYLYTNGKVGHAHPNTPPDLFGRLSAKLCQRHIATTGYLSVQWDENLARQFPEWTMRTAEGEPIRRRKWTEGEVHAQWTYLCLNSPYRDYLAAHTQELLAAYDMAALWVDILYVPRDIVCYCPYCRKLWQARFGRPIAETMTRNEYALWRRFYSDRQQKFYAEIQDLVRRSGKDILLTHNFGYPYCLDDYLATETEPGGQDYFRPSRLAKFKRAYAQGREVECIGYRFNHPWDFTTKPLPTLEWEIGTALAHNCAMTFVDQPLLRGNLDPKPYEALGQAFKVADALAPHVQGSVSYAEIALLAGEWSDDLQPATETDFAGAYCMLVESHLPFDVLADTLLEQTELSRYGVIVVANTVHLQPAAAAALRLYVAKGGVLLFTNRSATLDWNAEPLSEPSFGFVNISDECPYLVSFIKPVQPVSDSRIRVQHSVFFEVREGTVEATFTPAALEVTGDKWISHNVMPGLDSQLPAAVSGQHGEGTFYYIAPCLFREYIMQDLPSIREFVLGLLQRSYQPKIWVEAPRCVEAVYQQKNDELVIVLLNGITDKPRAGGNFRVADRGYVGMTERIPISGVSIHVLGGPEVEAMDKDGRACTVTRGDDETIIEIPRLDLYDVIRLPLGALKA